MDLKDEIREKATKVGFDLFGVSDIEKVEELGPQPNRGLKSPSQVMQDAKSLLILGIVIWDEAMNLAMSNARPGGVMEAGVYYNFYYEVTENRAWRLIRWLRDEKNIKAIPTHKIHMKPAAMLAGLGFIGHNTQLVTEKYGPRVRFVGILTEAVVVTDYCGRIIAVSPAVTSLLGYSPDDLIGHPLDELLDGSPDVSTDEGLFEQKLPQGRHLLRHRTGERLPVAMRSEEVREGKTIVVAIVLKPDSAVAFPSGEGPSRDVQVRRLSACRTRP